MSTLRTVIFWLRSFWASPAPGLPPEVQLEISSLVRVLIDSAFAEGARAERARIVAILRTASLAQIEPDIYTSIEDVTTSPQLAALARVAAIQSAHNAAKAIAKHGEPSPVRH